MNKYEYTSDAIDNCIRRIGEILNRHKEAEKHDILISFPFLTTILVNNDDEEINCWRYMSVRVNKQNYVDIITKLLRSEEMSDKLSNHIEHYLTDLGKEKIKTITRVKEG